MGRHSLLIIAAVACALGGGGGGCIILPIPHPSTRFAHSRRAIDDAATRPVEPGMTREELLLRLGEPDHVFHDGRTMIWHWTTCEWSLLVGFAGRYGGGGGGALDMPNNHYLRIGFDERGIVTRRDRRDDEPLKPVWARDLAE